MADNDGTTDNNPNPDNNSGGSDSPGSGSNPPANQSPPRETETIDHTARDGLARLTDTVASLTETVGRLVDNLTDKDKTPVKVPWTHRGDHRWSDV